MAYCTQADLLNRITEAELAQLTSESGSVVVPAKVNDAIASADEEINSYCAVQYVVPMAPVPVRIKQLSLTMTLFYLYLSRAAKIGGVPEDVRVSYEDAVGFLKLVAAGKARIEGAVKPTEIDDPSTPTFPKGKRIFTHNSMEDL